MRACTLAPSRIARCFFGGRTSLTWLVTAVVLAAAFVAAPRDASGLAKITKYYVKYVPAYVTAAYTASDGDTNLVLMPTGVAEERKRFFETFWWSGNKTWERALNCYLAGVGGIIDVVKNPAMAHCLSMSKSPGENVARQSSGGGQMCSNINQCCKECASNWGGPGKCLPFDLASPSNACKGLLGCAHCVYVLSENDPYNTAGIEQLEMASFTPVAEVEFEDEVEDSSAVRQVLHLGNNPNSGGSSWCDEFANPGLICGSKVYLSGLFALDQGHSDKPEIHPIQTMLVEDANIKSPVQIRKQFGVAALIDGSDSGFYRKLPDYLYPHIAEVDLARFQGSQPAAGWIPFCKVNEVYRYRVSTVRDQTKQIINAKLKGTDWGVCPVISVSMPKPKESCPFDDCGAGWVAKADFGWRKVNYQFSFDSKLLTPDGMMTVRPQAMPKPSPNKFKQRWYRFRVNAKVQFPPGVPAQWTWEVKPKTVILGANPKPNAPFDVWMPVSEKLSQQGVNPYRATIEVEARAHGQLILRDKLILNAPHQPWAKLKKTLILKPLPKFRIPGSHRLPKGIDARLLERRQDLLRRQQDLRSKQIEQRRRQEMESSRRARRLQELRRQRTGRIQQLQSLRRRNAQEQQRRRQALLLQRWRQQQARARQERNRREQRKREVDRQRRAREQQAREDRRREEGRREERRQPEDERRREAERRERQRRQEERGQSDEERRKEEERRREIERRREEEGRSTPPPGATWGERAPSPTAVDPAISLHPFAGLMDFQAPERSRFRVVDRWTVRRATPRRATPRRATPRTATSRTARALPSIRPTLIRAIPPIVVGALRKCQQPTYTVWLSAAGGGLYGPRSTWKWSLARDSKPIAARFPYKLELCSGDSVVLDLSVTDAQGVERASRRHYFQTPIFITEIERTIPKGTKYQQTTYRFSTGLAKAGLQTVGPLTLKVPKRIALVARPSEGGGDPFTKTPGKGPYNFQWKDIQYRSEQMFTFKAMPSSWRRVTTTHLPGDTLEITFPDASLGAGYAAAVTATDGWGRKASRTVVSGNLLLESNQAAQLAAQLMQKTFIGPRPGVIDPPRHQLIRLLEKAKYISPTDPVSAADFLTDLEAVGRAAFRRVARTRGLRFNARRAPVFSVLSTHPRVGARGRNLLRRLDRARRLRWRLRPAIQPKQGLNLLRPMTGRLQPTIPSRLRRALPRRRP